MPAFYAEMFGEQLDYGVVGPAILRWCGHVHLQLAGGVALDGVTLRAWLNANLDCLFAGDTG